MGIHVVERLNCQWRVSNYLDGHGILEMQLVVLNSSICTATNVTTRVVSHGMVCTWALSVLIVAIATCELFHALHGLHNGDNIYMNYKYLHELQEDLATAKVFYHKQFALCGICICSKQALNVIYQCLLVFLMF